MQRLPVMVAKTKINETVPVIVWRNGQQVSLSVEVGEQEDEEVARRQSRSKSIPRIRLRSSRHHIRDLGLSLAKVTDQNRKRYGLPKDLKGLVVIEVSKNGPASQKGIQPGDVIIGLTRNPPHLSKKVKDQVEIAREKSRKSVLLLIRKCRRGQKVCCSYTCGKGVKFWGFRKRGKWKMCTAEPRVQNTTDLSLKKCS